MATLDWRCIAALALAMSTAAGCATTGDSAAQDPVTRGTPASEQPSSSTASGVGLFDVGGRQLYAHCPPAEGPTVVFLHGAGGGGADWSAAAEQTTGVRTCWYDRFNVGASGHDDARHDPAESVTDLHALLAAVGGNRPYLLVGHSFGGLLALMYAGTYPDDVAGIVLADAVLPFETELDPPDTVDAVRADVNGWERGLDAYNGYAEAQRLERKLPDVPITYIYATQQHFPTEWPPGSYQRRLRTWVDRLPRGTLVRCRCDHDIPLDHPELAVEQIQNLLDGMR